MGKPWFSCPTRWRLAEVSVSLQPLEVVSHFDTFSAFEMLRNAKLRTADFAKVIPDLATVDPHILSRIDVDGAPCHI
jgi:hypothetical protein